MEQKKNDGVHHMSKMKKKKFDWFKVFIIIFMIAGLTYIFLYLPSKFLKPQFTITKDGVEVNNLTTCCMEIKDTDYFENSSYYYNVSQTSTVNYMDKKTICVPEEQNILGFDCKLIEKEDLDGGWLDENCECVENIKYTRNSAESSINVPCSKYKFGDYFINIEK